MSIRGIRHNSMQAWILAHYSRIKIDPPDQLLICNAGQNRPTKRMVCLFFSVNHPYVGIIQIRLWKRCQSPLSLLMQAPRFLFVFEDCKIAQQ